MKCLNFVLLLALVGALFTCAPALRAGDDIDWEERFLKEAPRRWQDYKDLKVLQGSYVLTTKQGAKVVSRKRLSYKQSKTCALNVVEDLLSKDQLATLQAINSRYAFTLKRASGDKPWAITGEDLKLKDGWKLSHTSPADGVQNWVSEPFNLNGTALARLPTLVKDPDFSIESAKQIVRDKTTLIEIQFKTKPKRADDGGWLPVEGGRVVFDPERYWVIRECDVQFKYRPDRGSGIVSNAGTFEYVDGTKKLPIPKRILRTWPGGQTTEEFDLIERKDVPEEEFTLSAFGLPEPTGLPSQARAHWYIWAAIGGCACVGAGAALRWLTKQRTT